MKYLVSISPSNKAIKYINAEGFQVDSSSYILDKILLDDNSNLLIVEFRESQKGEPSFLLKKMPNSQLVGDAFIVKYNASNSNFSYFTIEEAINKIRYLQNNIEWSTIK